MSKVLITFAGSHDLNKNTKGPVEQIINYLKPTKTYIFLTSEYVKPFTDNSLIDFYKGLTDDVTVINTSIINPTDSEEIANKISKELDKINEEVLINKWQSFVNLTSGTPAILSVLSLFIITGQLNRAFGVYAPNPKYDNEIKLTPLDFYRNSFAYKTMKDMINLMDYIAIDEFLTKNQSTFPKLTKNEDFKLIVDFAKQRATCNYEKTQELYEKNDILKSFQFKKPDNLFEKSAELYMSANIAKRKSDEFQATLKAGIVRENLCEFLTVKLLDKLNIDILEIRTSKNNEQMFFKQENIENYSELFDFIQKELNSSTSGEKSFDKKREINSFTMGIIMRYCLSICTNKKLDMINKEFYKLENLKSERNKLAHTINPPKFNPYWFTSIEKIINLISEEFGLLKPDFDAYKKINQSLLKILKETLNG